MTFKTLVPIEKRLRASLALDALNSTSYERAVVADQIREACTQLDSLRGEVGRLHEEISALRAQRCRDAFILRSLHDYFDQRADAEYFSNSPLPKPNQEMELLQMIKELQAAREPERGKAVIQWSEHRPGNSEIPYDHVVAETPFGRFEITWKGWKEHDSPTVDETPWGDYFGAFVDVDEAKRACEQEYARRLNMATPQPDKQSESEGREAVVQVDCFPCWQQLQLTGETDEDCPECRGVGHYFESVRSTPQPDKWIPEGWKLVPIKATKEIEDAIGRSRKTLKASEVWEVAVQFAPTPPEQESNNG